MAQAIVHNGIVTISGQVDDVGSDVTSQTNNILNKVDTLLTEAGTDKTKLLTANIWVKDIENDFQDMNNVWSAWLDPNNKPVRATGEVESNQFKFTIE
jgi:enamine deaminase RidA (YjgF/YER057c/UK114 family)